MARNVLIYSLNELETLARKAARGAGLEWGIAEEAAIAARWLAERRLPLKFTNILHNRTVLAPPAVMKEIIRGTRCEKRLCPLVTGIFLCDGRQYWRDSLTLNNVVQPLWLAPFIATTDTWMNLCWSGVKMIVGAGQLYLLEQSQLSAAVADVTIGREKESPCGVAVAVADCGSAQDEEEWHLLESLAANCYVLANEQSRRHGAGEQAKADVSVLPHGRIVE